jgi:hypothetical protein
LLISISDVLESESYVARGNGRNVAASWGWETASCFLNNSSAKGYHSAAGLRARANLSIFSFGGHALERLPPQY